jgi:hypothetical protein
MVKLPGGGLMVNGKYQGEQLKPEAREFFTAVKSGTVDQFVVAHPELVNSAK